MQLNTKQHTLETNAPQPIRPAKINTTAQMFKILSSQIYTQKELAVVRELLSNAYDAHVSAGTVSTPIEVHLPTQLEPYFAIRDYGTGLAPKAVETLYMDYGNSDKTDSNELIGGFGLGSKAPFCMTDQFTTISRHNGQAHTFQAFIQQDGSPACIHMESTPTDEPNGLTITVPVSASDYTISRFEYALRRIGRFLPVSPVSYDGTELCPKDTATITVELEGLAPLRRVYVMPRNPEVQAKHALIQGIVPYGLDSGIWSDITSDRNTSDAARRLLYGHLLVLNVVSDIGSFELAVSREALSLSDSETTRLRELLSQAAEQVAQKLCEHIQTASTWYEGVSLCHLTNLTKIEPTPAWRLLPHVEQIYLNVNALMADRGVHFSGRYCKVKTHRRRQRNYENTGLSTLSPQILKDLEIYIAPKKSYSAHRFAQQYYETHEAPLLLLVGDRKTAEAALRNYGIPHPVQDMPYIAPPKQARHAYGKHRYAVRELYYDDDWYLRSIYRTANELIDLVNKAHTVFLSEDTDINLASLRHLAAIKLYTLDRSRTYLCPHVPEAHKRVLATLTTELKEQGATLYAHPREIVQYDQSVINATHTLAAVFSIVEKTLKPFNLDVLERLLAHAEPEFHGSVERLAKDVRTLIAQTRRDPDYRSHNERWLLCNRHYAEIDEVYCKSTRELAESVRNRLTRLNLLAPGFGKALLGEQHVASQHFQPLLRDLSQYINLRPTP